MKTTARKRLRKYGGVGVRGGAHTQKRKFESSSEESFDEWEEEEGEGEEALEEEDEEKDDWNKREAVRERVNANVDMDALAYNELMERQRRRGQSTSNAAVAAAHKRSGEIQTRQAENTDLKQLPVGLQARIILRQRKLRPKELSDVNEQFAIAQTSAEEAKRTVDVVSKVMQNKYGIVVYASDLVRLLPGKWLSDNIINYAFELLRNYDRQLAVLDPARVLSAFFNSFFYSKLMEGNHYNYQRVRSWNTDERLFESHFAFFPVNLGNFHWVLVVADIPEHTVTMYDSLYGHTAQKVLPNVKRYLQNRYAEEHEGRSDPHPWQLVNYRGIEQENGSDCGVYTIMTANLLLSGLPVTKATLNANVAPTYRLRLAAQILANDLGYAFFTADGKTTPAPAVPPPPKIRPFMDRRQVRLAQVAADPGKISGTFTLQGEEVVEEEKVAKKEEPVTFPRNKKQKTIFDSGSSSN